MKVVVEYEMPVALLSDTKAREFLEDRLKEVSDHMFRRFGDAYVHYPSVAYFKDLGWVSQEDVVKS